MHGSAVLLLTYDRIQACYKGSHATWDYLFYMTLEVLMHQERKQLGLNAQNELFYPNSKNTSEHNN